MKKCLVLTMLLALLILTACGQKQAPAAPASAETAPTGGSVQLTNPWREVSQAEAEALVPRSFGVPEGAENARWSVMDSAADASGVPGPLVQLSFDLDGSSFTAREQRTNDAESDSSGMYYEWTVQDESTLQKWPVENGLCRLYRYIGVDEYADLCTWYDAEAGVSYSLSVTAKDLDGFDIRAVADALYVPDPAAG